MRKDFFIPLRPKTFANNTKNKRIPDNNRAEFIRKFIELRENEFDSRVSNKKSPFDKKVSIKVIFYFEGNYNGDIDNLLKTLFDALQKSGIIKNDNQIRRVNAELKDNSIFEGISVLMESL